MKTLSAFSRLLLLGVFAGSVSCNKVAVDPVDRVNTTKIEWKTVDLNIDYTIQFPENQYVGSGFKLRTPGSFGDKTTLITRNDEQANLSATFCDPSAYPCLLVQYGERLKLPLPDSIPFLNSKGENAYLNNRITFGKENKVLAVLYYGKNPGVTFRPYEGRLYTVSRATGLPQHAGSVAFNEATKGEVVEILSTITSK